MSMNKHEIIGFIRDQMLTNPEYEAHIVWTIANYAESNDKLYGLMQEWMKEEKSILRDGLILEMQCITNQYKVIPFHTFHDRRH